MAHLNISRYKEVCLITLSLAISLLSMAQRTITGKVNDNNNQPLTGATVTVKGTSSSTTTDDHGFFKLTASEKDVLVVTSVGYAPKEVKASEASLISLSSDVQNLSEVVITALGVKKEVKRLGYSIQEVKGEDLVKARDANPITGLTGKVAGLSVGPSAELLRKPLVLLRGNEITLYVVDGIPISSDTWNISPDDIETYSVLKGPSAAA